MAVCSVCKNSVLFSAKFANYALCSRCARIIQLNKWKEEQYLTNDEVRKRKATVVEAAKEARFPSELIAAIERKFNSEIEKGLLYRFDGQEDQILKVFETHIEIVTGDNFEFDEMKTRYARSCKYGRASQSIFEDGTALRSLANSVISGRGLLKAGLSLATGAAIDSAINQRFPGKKDFNVTRGKKKISYTECSDVFVMENNRDKDGCVGFVKFILKNSTEYIFFYDCTDLDYEVQIFKICSKISELIFEAKEKMQDSKGTSALIGEGSSVADEILKFKQLLDMGIITGEEFEKKKNQLLRLE